MNKQQRNTSRIINNATTWNLFIWESDLPRNCKLVACYLRTHMNDYQELAFPSVGRIAGYCGLTGNPVRDALKLLCKSGFLVEQGIHPKYGTKIYGIATPSESEALQNMSKTPSESEAKLTKLTNQVSLSKQKKRFSPPDLAQLMAYQEEANLAFDPNGFMDYWISVGWKRGRTPMKCWKATARQWARRENKGTTKPGGRPSSKSTTIETDLTDRSWAN